MISNVGPVAKEFARKIFEATHNEHYTACSLLSMENEDNMRVIIKLIDDNPGIKISKIEEKYWS